MTRQTVASVLCLCLLTACARAIASPEEQLSRFFQAFQEGDRQACADYTDHATGFEDSFREPDIFKGQADLLFAWQAFLDVYNHCRQDFSYYIESSEIQGSEAVLTIVIESRPLRPALQAALDASLPGLEGLPESQRTIRLLEAFTYALSPPPASEKEVIDVYMVLEDDRWRLADENPALWTHLEGGIMELTL